MLGMLDLACLHGCILAITTLAIFKYQMKTALVWRSYNKIRRMETGLLNGIGQERCKKPTRLVPLLIFVAPKRCSSHGRVQIYVLLFVACHFHFGYIVVRTYSHIQFFSGEGVEICTLSWKNCPCFQ